MSPTAAVISLGEYERVPFAATLTICVVCEYAREAPKIKTEATLVFIAWIWMSKGSCERKLEGKSKKAVVLIQGQDDLLL